MPSGSAVVTGGGRGIGANIARELARSGSDVIVTARTRGEIGAVADVHLCCRAVIPGMLERGSGRIVIVGSGAAYLPGATETGYTASKAAVCRYGETLANALRDRIPVFVVAPGLVRTAMTADVGDDAPWTPPECAPRLVAALATGEFDALAGRYLHAEHDPPEKLRERVDAILESDLNAIRLRR
jgi:3-oxoacyl-[acyl-carrier protein] reductase